MLQLYNSLTRKIEEFVPLDPKNVRVYTCGPTVYSFATIGNFRTYTMADILIRALKLNGYRTKYLMNITDVGHLTGDNVGDADTGEDRMEKSATKEGKTAWEVAAFYTDVFLDDYKALNLSTPELFAKATDYINEQIALVQILEEKGFTYQTTDGIYFDTSKFPNYGELSNLDEIKEGARVEINPEKKNPRDFALWKFSPKGEKRQMEWKSPWGGKGFPGWHIECSAMSMKYLGPHFDIHTGGMDLKSTHHPNEIAQSEAATGETFVNYWMHGAFVLVNGEKMSKSKGNAYRIYDLEKARLSAPEGAANGGQGFEPLALRYLYLQTHYRQEMNFTFPGLESAQNALHNLREKFIALGLPKSEIRAKEYEERFKNAVNDDLNMPQALAVVWELLSSAEDNNAKINSLVFFDKVLGLNLESARDKNRPLSVEDAPDEVRELIEEREMLRNTRHYAQADQVRNKIKKLGYDVLDTKKGSLIKKIEE